MRKSVIFLLFLLYSVFLFSQDFMKEVYGCMIKGDYKCVVRNLRMYHEDTGIDVRKKVAEAEECGKYQISADALFEADAFANAGKYYSKILDINPKDTYSKKQYDICLEKQGKTSSISGVAANTKWEIDMVYVQGGTFTMGCTSEQGSACDSDEKPAHQVTLSSYYIGKYEVTQKQWQEITGNNPSYFKGDNLPVEQVSWEDVQDFIRQLNRKTGKNYRLPTEAEWEYAARGGSKSRSYKYSGSNTADEVAWYSNNSSKKTHPVGTKQSNELGIYDMSGNVWEWCNDRTGAYSSSSQTNPIGATSGSYYVLRGGGWFYIVKGARVSNRYELTPDYRRSGLGFRLAL
jgi:formylglycine-generating enzyme required for sulfatase activity